MKNVTKTKPFMVSLLLLFLGILFLVMESTFYGYVDQNGALHESFFLPMGVISFWLGMAGLILSIIWFYLKRLRDQALRKKQNYQRGHLTRQMDSDATMSRFALFFVLPPVICDVRLNGKSI